MWIEVSQDRDELGEPEQLAWDLFPLVDSALTLHLDTHGLPKVGAFIRPGMILVGKIGKTKEFDPHKAPTALEIQGCETAKLREKYGAMWKDSSVYATEALSGFVRQAYLEELPTGLRAIVEIEPVAAPAARTHATSSAVSA